VIPQTSVCRSSIRWGGYGAVGDDAIISDPRREFNDVLHVNLLEYFLVQRRKDAKKTLGNAVALGVFAPLREKYLTLLAGG
jgi:hypothetical protein